MGRWVDLIGPGLVGLIMACPFQVWGRLREAGFTEQRTPPALDGGRITGLRLPSPL
ncbi:hypothetical protein Bca4012_028516 [Brassica carinata]